MRQFQYLPTAVCLMALALPQLARGQDVLLESDATYHYLLTIADINGSGMAVDPTTIDPSFAVIDPNSQISNIALWPFPTYDPAGANEFAAGLVRDTGEVEVLQWRQAQGPFQYGGVAGVGQGPNGPFTVTDLLIDSGLGFTESQLDGQKLTQYFRTNFTTTTAYTDVLLDVLIDDAAVFYIDGFEVARYNCCDLPDGSGPETAGTDVGGVGAAPYFDSVANGGGDVGDETIRNNNWDPPWEQGVPNAVDLIGFAGGTLPAGDHVFGVEVHSYGAFNSSDLGFDVRLTATGGTPGDACDFDGDTLCNTADIDMLTAEIGTGGGNLSLDINNDGSINIADRDEWLSQAATKNGLSGPYLLGDANLDGSVNAQDLNDLGLRWRMMDNAFSHGDFNADGNVNAADLNELGLSWQQTVPAAAAATAVPEPSALSLLWLAALGLLGRSRRN